MFVVRSNSILSRCNQCKFYSSKVNPKTELKEIDLCSCSGNPYKQRLAKPIPCNPDDCPFVQMKRIGKNFPKEDR